jgi:heme exporter protein CcmD
MVMHRYANPARFLRIVTAILPWSAGVSAVALPLGVYFALIGSPPDYQQGDTVRIMYVHVPAAWMALMIYTVMAASAAAALVWRHPVAELVAQAAAPIGAVFTAMCLITGSLWGQPMWGTWWVWDARLTSVRAGRLRQRADHQVLGRLVEHLAPAGERDAARRSEHRRPHAGAAVHHGGRLHGVLRHRPDPARAHRADAAQAARAAARPGARLIRMPDASFWAMGGYAAYVWPAYAVTTLALLGLLFGALRGLRQAERELASLEGSRARRRAPRGAAAGDLA